MSTGIYLPNMEMPRKGQMLVIFPDGTSYVCFNGMRERLAQTEAVPVPPHGRLIDADALSAKLNTMLSMAFGEGNTAFHFAYRSLGKMVENAPTIIPAEPCKEKGE